MRSALLWDKPELKCSLGGEGFLKDLLPDVWIPVLSATGIVLPLRVDLQVHLAHVFASTISLTPHCRWTWRSHLPTQPLIYHVYFLTNVLTPQRVAISEPAGGIVAAGVVNLDPVELIPDVDENSGVDLPESSGNLPNVFGPPRSLPPSAPPA